MKKKKKKKSAGLMKVFCIAKIDAKYVFVWLLGKVKVFYNDGCCRAGRCKKRVVEL